MVENSKVGKKLSGVFRGKVLAHLPCGRCKVFIPDVYPEEWATETSKDLKDAYGKDLKGPKLPDAVQATPLFGGGTSSFGMFSYPKVGSYVFCMFERGDINFPIYFAAAMDVTDLKGDDRFSYVPLYAGTNENSQKHIIQCGKTSITFDEKGILELSLNDKMKISLNEEKNEITIYGENIVINGDNIQVGNKFTKSISLNSDFITSNANIRILENCKLYALSADESAIINNKEFSNLI